MIIHYDLFAGIGGNSIALEEVFDEPIRHIFCEWEQFPTAVLRKHWPDGEYWGDIAELVADTERQRPQQRQAKDSERYTELSNRDGSDQAQDWTILTGGFPCQPFSAAGRRKGTADDRYKWPEMFAVIQNVKPDWVVAENVRGLVTWSEGLVLEQVCADLESEGYEVQPIIIPAVAVNAPHRRDRVWVIGHSKHNGLNGPQDRKGTDTRSNGYAPRAYKPEQPTGPDIPRSKDAGAIADTGREHGSKRPRSEVRPEIQEPTRAQRQYPDWQRNWQEVAFATCDDSMDDGLPRIMDGTTIGRAKWRKESLKAYRNAIVPQVAMEIFKAIKISENTPNENEGNVWNT